MSYKHLEDIQNIYENISEPIDKQLVSEASAILIDTMFSEGYSENAIAEYALNANPDDIVERIAVAAENYIFIEASQLNESVDGVEYEILEENSQQVANLQGLVEKALIGRALGALGKVLRPAGRGIATSAKRAGKLASEVGGNIAKKGSEVGGNIAKKGSEVGGNIAKKGKALVSGAGTALKPVGDAVKKYGPTAAIAGGAGLVGVPLAIGAAKGLYKAGKSAVKNVKKFVKGGTDAFKKPEVKKDDSLSFKNMKDKGLLDKNLLDKKPEPKVVPGSEKIIPARPANPSGKELPKARTIGPGKGQINPNSARGQMIAKNKERFGKDSDGKDRVEKLRDKNAAFQKAKKKGSGYSMDDFAKDFPNSNTAKERNKRNRVTSVMDMESYDAFDIVSNYLFESNQVDNMDEALYVMSEMDATTIQGIVNEHHQKDENGNTVPHE